MRALLNHPIKIEYWSKESEQLACSEDASASAGAPHYIALNGTIQCVTRRCAEKLIKAKQIIGTMPARDPSNIGIGFAALKACAEGQSIGLTFKLESIEDGVWLLYCPQMRFESATRNPTKEILLLSSEWIDIVEGGAPFDIDP